MAHLTIIVATDAERGIGIQQHAALASAGGSGALQKHHDESSHHHGAQDL